MAIKRYLAMTAAEIAANEALPPHMGYMACHFSPYGTGLCNLPRTLPEGSMLILNDRIPPRGHDRVLVAEQLTEAVQKLRCGCVLLDFQQPGFAELQSLAELLADTLPCPVGVSQTYAAGLDCPVFLPPVPPDVRAETHLMPWQGREIWLELTLEGLEIRLTPEGTKSIALPYPALPESCRKDDRLHCSYAISADENSARFTLFRTREDLEDLLVEAEGMGVTRAVGLWQEFRDSGT